MSDLSVMGFLDEDTQQETEYNLKDAQARQSISVLGNSVDAIENKIPDNASSSNKLATISDVSAAYKPKGNATLATLPSLTIEHLNWVYNMTEDFITTSDFAEGAGILVKAGNEVGIFDVSTTSTPSYKYTVLGGFIDTSGFYNTSETLETDVDGQDKFPFWDFSASAKRHITFGSIKAKLKEYFDLFYTNLVSSATNGNFAGLDANGNLVDSGKKASDFATTGNAIANTKLIKDTVGWSGKNICPYPKGTRQVILSDGSIQDNSDMYSSDYVSVDGISKLRISVGSVTGSSIAFRIATYDTSKTFIERLSVAPTASTPIIQTLGSTVKYVRFCFEDNSSIARYTQPMVIDNNILDTSYEPAFNSTAFPRSEQAVLGAGNLLDKTKATGVSADVAVTQTTTGVRGVVANASTWKSISIIMPNDVKNYGLTLASNVEITSGVALLKVEGTDMTTFTTIAESSPITTSGRLKLTFNTGNYPYLRMQLYVTGGADKNTGDVTYNDLCLSTDPDPTYAPFAMTNRELTEKVTPEKFNLIPKTNDITIDYQANYKIGKIVLMNFRVVSVSDSIPTGDYQIAETLDSKYCPAVGGQDVMGIACSTWDASHTCLANIGRYGSVKLNGAEKNVYYVVNAAYVTD